MNELAIEQLDLPSLKPKDVRVAIKSLGICQSDVHYLRHGRIADFVLRAPMVIGHECAGEVAAVGPAVTSLKVRPELHGFDRIPPWYPPNSFGRLTPVVYPNPTHRLATAWRWSRALPAWAPAAGSASRAATTSVPKCR